ncbi:MAG: tyrosine recombinase [Acidobacteriota bacterium]|nr:tyrosine recombinase [Acidobacteriota bacterium]
MEPSSADPRIADYLTWLSVERGRSRATLEADRRDLEGLLTWCDERGLEATELTTEDLEAYLDAMRHHRATSTVARRLAAVRGWLGWLVDEGRLSADPSARLRPGRRARSLPKPLAESLVMRLIDSVAGGSALDRRDRALLEFLYGTGARVSEAVGVRLEDLDFDEELILVTGKGDKQRLVPMGRELRRSLANYLAPGGRGELAGASRDSHLFLNARGGPLSRQGVDLVVRRRALAAGLPSTHLSAHVLRHSCATHLLAHGADIRVVQELLGHASIATTQIYTAVSVTSLRRAYLGAHPRAQG